MNPIKENNYQLEKDIIMLCKSHYSNQYKTLLDAFNAYYQKHYCCPDVVMDYRFAVELFLKPTTEYLLKNYEQTRRSFINNGLFSRCSKEPLFKNEDGAAEFYEVLYHRLITWITLLQIRKKDEYGKYQWLIDLSGYEDDQDII